MRSQRTQEEDKYIDIFKVFLTAQGKTVVIDDSITDRPDLFMKVDGKTIGCELTNIGLPALQKWHRLQRVDLNEIDTIHIPFEPELWGLEILKKKYNKQYSHKCDEAWLLIHVDSDLFLYEEGSNPLKKLGYYFSHFQDSGAYKHSLSRVYLSIGENVFEVWTRGQVFNRPIFGKKKGLFPIITLQQTRFKVNENGANIDMSEKPKKETLLPSLDPNIKIKH